MDYKLLTEKTMTKGSEFIPIILSKLKKKMGKREGGSRVERVGGEGSLHEVRCGTVKPRQRKANTVSLKESDG